MKQAFIKNRVYFAALLAILLSLCLALAFGYALPRSAYAEDAKKSYQRKTTGLLNPLFYLLSRQKSA